MSQYDVACNRPKQDSVCDVLGHDMIHVGHLIAAVSGKSDFLHGVPVHDPFHELQVGSHKCDLPHPTTGHRAAANQRRIQIRYQRSHIRAMIASYEKTCVATDCGFYTKASPGNPII